MILLPLCFKTITKTYLAIRNKSQIVITKENFLTEYFNEILVYLGGAFFGFFIGRNFAANNMIFFNTDYLRYRLFYEKSIGYVRTEGLLLNEYPFAHKEKYLLNDLEVLEKNKLFAKKNLIMDPDTQKTSQGKIKLDNLEVNNFSFNTYSFEIEKK